MFGPKNETSGSSMGMTRESSGNDVGTVVGKAVKIEGNLIAKEDIRVEGIVEGKIITEKHLYIGEGAVINADIEAHSALIAGDVHGNVKVTTRLELANAAKINGNVKAKVVIMSEGAVLNGQCEMNKEVDKKPMAEVNKVANGEDKK
jgi:cytoskeletal protein CcmA (bactofilin family)